MVQIDSLKHVYIIGSKGIPAKYGGFETFVEELTKNKKTDMIKYHVSCLNKGDNLYGNGEKHFNYNNADCFNISVSSRLGPAHAIVYDIKALTYAIKMAERNKDKEPVFYILACRIGPFINRFYKKITAIGGKLVVNPDGHEWLRAKWSRPVRRYWKESEKLMVKYADTILCDSKAIEEYIRKDYAIYRPNTKYIAYGAYTSPPTLSNSDKQVKEWYKKNGVQPDEYYLVVGRMVPENNYSVIINEFMKSNTEKNLVIITNIEKNKYYKQIKKEINIDVDSRIKFVGTVYDQELLKLIRRNSFAYLHGHEVGGTNPSLLEALGNTKKNLLLDVSFNREVGGNGAIYWNKTKDELKNIINELDNDLKDYTCLESLSRNRIINHYSWDFIVDEYENFFIGELND